MTCRPSFGSPSRARLSSRARLGSRARLAGAALTVLTVVAVQAVTAAPTAAQGPGYTATAPTKGALYRDGQTNRYLLGGAWLYRADAADVGVAHGFWHSGASTDGWSPVTVPNSFNAGDFSAASQNGSVGWYRRDFTLPSNAFATYVAGTDRHWIIRFESVIYRATVWLNGREIGTHAGGYLPFELTLSGLRPGVNRLIVRVDSRRGPADLPGGPGQGWWNFGGIQREVYLRPVQRADLAQLEVQPQLPCPSCAATVSVQALVHNLSNHAQLLQLHGRYGTYPLDFGEVTVPAHGTWTAAAQTRIAHPRLWAIGRPNLYHATFTLADGAGRSLAGYATDSGVRSITTGPDGRLRLNGRLLHLRGVNLHEQDIVEGAALDPAHVARLFGWVKSIGATIVRAHYPLNPEFEELADREGVLLWSEIPVNNVASRYLVQPAWRAHALDVLRTNILTNGNHPSVAIWSIGNELGTPPDGNQASWIGAATAYAHKLDPTRPVGIALADWPGVGCQAAYRPLDVLGINEYFGWFDSGGGLNDDRDSLSPFLDATRACYPTKALLVTEFGFEGNRHGPVEERGTYEFQANSAAFHLGVFASKPWLSGALWFALQDFANSPGWAGGDPVGDPPFVQKGAIDLYGNRKPLFPVLSSIYHQTVQIAPAAKDLRGARR